MARFYHVEIVEYFIFQNKCKQIVVADFLFCYSTINMTKGFKMNLFSTPSMSWLMRNHDGTPFNHGSHNLSHPCFSKSFYRNALSGALKTVLTVKQGLKKICFFATDVSRCSGCPRVTDSHPFFYFFLFLQHKE